MSYYNEDPYSFDPSTNTGIAGGDQAKRQAIEGYYGKYLNRTSDEGGMNNWLSSGLGLSDIEAQIRDSEEARQRTATNNATQGWGTYQAQAPADPSKFIGYDFGAHQGQTFSYGNPAEGAKYAVANYLANIDPNSQDWAARAAADLNRQFGSNIFSAQGGQRLSYGDEAVDSTKQAGKFFWIGAGPGGGGTAGAGAGAGQPDPMQAELLARLDAQEQANAERVAADRQRSDELYNLLKQRATQGLAVDRNDPVIRAQADARAQTNDRATRDYLGDLAEKAGPLANLRGEQRMAAERLGTANSSFEAELMGRELTARRGEIEAALNGMRGLLSGEQQMSLQRELAQLDAAIKQQSLAQNQSQFGSDLAYRYAQMQQQDSQFGRSLGQRESEYGRDLGYRYNAMDNQILQQILDNLGR